MKQEEVFKLGTLGIRYCKMPIIIINGGKICFGLPP